MPPPELPAASLVRFRWLTAKDLLNHRATETQRITEGAYSIKKHFSVLPLCLRVLCGSKRSFWFNARASRAALDPNCEDSPMRRRTPARSRIDRRLVCVQ